MNQSVQINIEDAIENLLAHVPNLNTYKTNRGRGKAIPLCHNIGLGRGATLGKLYRRL
jgi:hypothetical protein